MPQIKQYDAPDRRITPEEKGYSAFETAGRRVGPLYNQAGNDIRDMGRLENEVYKQRMWPWDFLVADDRRKGGGSGGGGGGGFKTQGFQSDPFGQFAAHGQTSRGAGHLGGAIEDYEGPATGIAKSAQFVDGSGNSINRGQIGRGFYAPNGGQPGFPAGKKNPYGEFGSTEYGYAPPPPVPPPLDRNGNPIQGPGGFRFDPNSGSLDSKGRIQNPGYQPVDANGNPVQPPPVPSYYDMHRDDYTGYAPATPDQSNEPVPLPGAQQLRDWIGDKSDQGGGGYNDTGL